MVITGVQSHSAVPHYIYNSAVAQSTPHLGSNQKPLTIYTQIMPMLLTPNDNNAINLVEDVITIANEAILISDLYDVICNNRQYVAAACEHAWSQNYHCDHLDLLISRLQEITGYIIICQLYLLTCSLSHYLQITKMYKFKTLKQCKN